MRYIKSYEQLNESTSSDTLKSLLDKFSNKIDSKKLAELVITNKDILIPYYKKYVKDGVVNADMIYSDFSKFNFKANEGYWNDDDYADDENNHPVLRFLYKLFVRWPKNFITGVWSIFKDTVIDSWRDNKFISIMMSVLWIISSILIYLLGYLTYSLIEHEVSGLDSGIVKAEDFKPAHYESHIHTVSNGNSTMTYTTSDWVPDAWFVEVEGESGRVETWQTYNREVGSSVNTGDKVINDDNWTWCGTDEE
jgi:hypothetical protein